jgi:Ca-activated chloride channel family protein
MSDGWKIDELAERSGFSVRTLRYYLARGLLPAPPFRGPKTTYDESYLTRLSAIRALEADEVPLDAIAELLAHATAAEIARIARDGRRPAPAPSSPAPVPLPGAGLGRRFAVARRTTFTLAPGLRLEVDEPVDAATEALLAELLETAQTFPARAPSKRTER